MDMKKKEGQQAVQKMGEQKIIFAPHKTKPSPGSKRAHSRLIGQCEGCA